MILFFNSSSGFPGVEVGAETDTPPTLVPDAEVGAETDTPPTLVGKIFRSSEPNPM